MTGARRGAVFGLLAAATFGVSAPLCKLLLLDGAGPLALAGLLYAGAALALSVATPFVRRGRPAETPLRAADAPLVAAIAVAGGIAGPLLMLGGLARLPAVAGALLLNLEAPLTALVAVLVFREHLGWRAAAAILLVGGGAALLAAAPGVATGGQGDWRGAAMLAAACLAWAVDNNLTQRLSLRDPLAVVRAKTAAAAAGSLALALVLRHAQPLPGARAAAGALAVGAVSYGASVVLDVHALRLLGAVREAAYFATAPFVGAVAGVLLFRAPLRLADAAAGALMAAGAVLLLRERHAHAHTHDAIEHEHLHAHDEHHQHPHDPPVTGAHSHPHRHAALTHSHPHTPDLHHRHRH